MTGTEPQFQRVTGTDLFWLVGSNRTIGFQSSPKAPIGDSPLLSVTWTDAGGIYLFLKAAPTSDSAFEAALLSYLPGQGWPNGPKFLWLQNPDDSYYSWSGQTLNLNQKAGAWSVSRRADFPFSTYGLTFPSGIVVTEGGSPYGFSFSGGNWFSPGGQYSANSTVLLSMDGASAGCWQFEINLANGAATPNDFEALRVGLRYFYPEDSIPNVGDMYVKALDLPTILQPTNTTLKLGVSLDFLQPLVPSRTHFSFFPSGVTSLDAFSSTFVTARGYSVTLTPLVASGNIPDARLVFNLQPLYVGSDQNVPTEYYLTLEGAFQIGWLTETTKFSETKASLDIYRLLCGGSGLEYLGLPTADTGQIQFLPGMPAYAVLPLTNDDNQPLLTPLGTTAWVYPTTTTNSIQYFAQPEDAPLYWAPPVKSDGGVELGSIFLDFLEVPAMTLAAQSGTSSFPIAPYFGLDSDSVDAALVVEANALAPTRRKILLGLDATNYVHDPLDLTSKVGVTPQGLSVGIGSDGMQWTWAGIANDTGSVANEPDLKFTTVSGTFRQSLQTNKLFMILTNPTEFATFGSVAYQLTAEGIAEIKAEGTVPTAILNSVASAFATNHYPIYDTETEFNNALLSANPLSAPYELVFQRKSGLLAPKIGDWHFQMSPRNWANPLRDQHPNSMVVYKFMLGRSLEELVEDVGSWAWPEVATFEGEEISATQIELRSIFQQAREADAKIIESGRQSPYKNFLNLIKDKDWTGIIAFSVDVPLSTLPEPLQFLAAGINPNQFYAHHIGFNMTPFGADPGTLLFGNTSTFGLIDYQDPVDQTFTEEIWYAFKVLSLTVGFRNSAMIDFSSRLELMINRLFGTTPNLFPTEHGNNVIMDGVYQKQMGSDGLEHGTYVFSMSWQNTLLFPKTALRQVELLSTQLVMQKTATPGDPDSKVVATFLMGGNMWFRDFGLFDLFSFGGSEPGDNVQPVTSDSYLRFGNLGIKMEFTMANPTPSFTFVTETLSFDMANSKARDKSLYNLFPLVLSGFIASPDPQVSSGDNNSLRGPDSLGYVTIGAPIQQAKMSDPWYGLVFDIDLGSLGALAASTSLTLRVLTAWAATGDLSDPPIYLGVQMPGVKDILGAELPLQGVISLGFRSIQFLVNDDDVANTREYMLRFRNFSVSFLGFSFPPGYNDILLIGNPDQTSTTKLAWYAAYSADDDKKKQSSVRRGQNNAARNRIPVGILEDRS